MSDVFDNLPPAPDNDEEQVTDGPVNDLPSEDANEDANEQGEKPTRQQGFKYPTHVDPMRRLGGVYLDDEVRREAEVRRAKVEDREPDLENPPAVQSTPLVASHTLERLDPRARDIEDDVTLTVGAGE